MALLLERLAPGASASLISGSTSDGSTGPSPRDAPGPSQWHSSSISSLPTVVQQDPFPGMASMLAHEIKNPLAGIRGAAQLLSPLLAMMIVRWPA